LMRAGLVPMIRRKKERKFPSCAANEQ